MPICRAKLDSILAERARFYDSADLKISLEGYCEDAERGAPTVVSVCARCWSCCFLCMRIYVRACDSADLKISLEGYCEDAKSGAPTVVSAYVYTCVFHCSLPLRACMRAFLHAHMHCTHEEVACHFKLPHPHTCHMQHSCLGCDVLSAEHTAPAHSQHQGRA